MRDALRDARAGQALSWPLRRLLQATGAVLLRLGGRRGDLWLRAHGSGVLAAGVPPHGLVPAAGVRSKGGRRGNGLLLRAAFLDFAFCSFIFLHSGKEGNVVTPAGVRTPDFPHLSAGPRPARPSWAPTAERPPAPAPPGSLCSGSVAGTGDVATRRGTAGSSRVSSCELDSRKKRAFLPRSGGAASAGGLAPAAHAPPPLSKRDLTAREGKRLPAHRASRSASCRAACCPFGDAPCVCFNGRGHRSRGRPVSAAHAATPGASLRSRWSVVSSVVSVITHEPGGQAETEYFFDFLIEHVR